MALRLLETVVSVARADAAREVFSDLDPAHVWELRGEDTVQFKALLDAEQTEPVLDALETRFGGLPDFRYLLVAVEAAVPAPKRPEQTGADDVEGGPGDIGSGLDGDAVGPGAPGVPETIVRAPRLRISRQELYADANDGARLTRSFMWMTVLSAIVAGVGLMRNNTAVIIGAMVIAPLLGPNVSLALATTLGDRELGRTSMRTNLVGVSLALLLSVFFGWLVGQQYVALPAVESAYGPVFVGAGGTVDLTIIPEIASRTSVTLWDVVLALVSGCAGVLAFTSGASASLVGVMVAVALMPPLVCMGLLLGAGQLDAALGAGLLLGVNVVCVNLAGIGTFRAQGIAPRLWYQGEVARSAARRAMWLWTALLLGLIVFFSRAGILTAFEGWFGG